MKKTIIMVAVLIGLARCKKDRTCSCYFQEATIQPGPPAPPAQPGGGPSQQQASPAQYKYTSYNQKVVLHNGTKSQDEKACTSSSAGLVSWTCKLED